MQVPEEYLNKEYVDLRKKTVYGVNACTAAAYDPFRKALIDNFDKGWEELMKYDWASTRSYLSQGDPKYPLSVIHWMETRNSGTGGFDRAFAEVRYLITLLSLPGSDLIYRLFLTLLSLMIPGGTFNGNASMVAASC